MIVVTVRTTTGQPIDDYAATLFQEWSVGHKDNRGVMPLLVVNSRKSRLEVGYGLEPGGS